MHRSLRHGRALALAVLALPALLLTAAGCGETSTASASQSRLTVVATTTQIADWVRHVGGGAIDVHQILQPNTDPHEYEPRPQDVETTAAANVVFENGDRLDHWMDEVVSQSGGQPRVVVLGDTVPVKLPGETSGAEASRFDPHWWHDPRNAEAAVEHIRAALAAADPDRTKLFAANAASYVSRLRLLDAGIRACIDAVPASARKLVTDHDAFGYFAHRYGITVVGAVIPSQTTEAEPSAGDVARLIGLIEREHVTAVFPESSLNPRLARMIASSTGASSAHTLYGDTLGPAGSAGATYLSMEQANANAMVSGFTGGRASCPIAGLG